MSDSSTSKPRQAGRVEAIDLLRGLAMVLMALDHTRDFFMSSSIAALDPNTSNWPLYLTRWISHLCAPSFVFLAGVSTWISSRRSHLAALQSNATSSNNKLPGPSIFSASFFQPNLTSAERRKLCSFLVTRGLWLIIMEWTIIHWFGWAFAINPFYLPSWVFWVLGWSMISLGVLIVLLPTWLIGVIGLTLVVGHHLFDRPVVPGIEPPAVSALEAILHGPGREFLWNGPITILPGWDIHLPKAICFAPGWPIIPWPGVMALGYCFGAFYTQPIIHRQATLFGTSLFLIAGGLLLRLTNLYGDPRPWASADDLSRTLMDFLNVNKYPPSLIFLMLTLGLAFLVLAWFDQAVPRFLQWFTTIGKVPFFFYLLHLPIIHSLAIAVVWIHRSAFPWWLASSPPLHTMPKDHGYPLAVTYVVWLVVLLLLYYPCAAYARFRTRNKHWIWSFL